MRRICIGGEGEGVLEEEKRDIVLGMRVNLYVLVCYIRSMELLS